MVSASHNIYSHGNLFVKSHVTASGNISASGEIITKEVSSLAGFTLDVAGDITLDADGADIVLSDDGTDFGRFKRDTSDFVIKSETNDKDILLKGEDNSSTITALKLDMSEAGSATFNSHITSSGNISATGNISASGYVTASSVGAQTGSFSRVHTNDIYVGDAGALYIRTGTYFTGFLTVQSDQNFRAKGDVYLGEDSADKIFITGNTTSSGNYSGSITSTIQVGGEVVASSANITNITGSNISGSGNYIGSTRYNITAAAAGRALGDIVYFGECESVEKGEVYNYSQDGIWVKADADAASTSTGLIGVALSNSLPDGFIIRGMVTLSADGGQVSEPLYLSTTAGRVSSTAPTGTGDIVRIIGYCMHSTTGQVWLSPDNSWIELT